MVKIIVLQWMFLFEVLFHGEALETDPSHYVVPHYNAFQFSQLIENSQGSIFVKFYAPWCGHCKSLKPVWNLLGQQFQDSQAVHIAQVDCTENQELCSKEKIKGYPTMKLFKKNQEMGTSITYKGKRNLYSLTEFLSQEINIPLVATTNIEATMQSMFGIHSYSFNQSALIVSLGFLAGIVLGFFFINYGATQKMQRPLFYSNIVPNSAKPGHGEIHRTASSNNDFPRPLEESIFHYFLKGLEVSKNQPCLGKRIVDSNGIVGPFVWQTYSKVHESILQFSSGIQHLELLSTDNDLQFLAIYMKNCPEWVIAELGGYAAKATIVSLYETLGKEELKTIVKQIEAKTIVCTVHELKSIQQIAQTCKSIKNLILVGESNLELEMETKKLGLQLYTFEEVLLLGQNNLQEITLPCRDDLAMLLYTSGTTGEAKGVKLTHGAIMANAEGDIAILNSSNPPAFSEKTIHLSYLPLSHILERIFQFCVWKHGGRVGFYQGNIQTLVDDLREIRPTVFISVPRMLNKMYDKILLGGRSSLLSSFLFNLAMSVKKSNLKMGYLGHPLWDKLIFNKIRSKLGLDRLTYIFTGAAPISPDVLDFFRICFSCPVLEGYGQSECGGGATISHPCDYLGGGVGGPLSCVEMKLVSIEEMNYLVTDTTHGIENPISCKGRGEICFRGPSVFQGYYKLDNLTKEVIDEDGWLHSGDIGLWTLDGRLIIIDRKKSIFKLSQGEYIAPEKIENALLTSPYVAQCFVYGDSLHSHTVAILVPNEDILQEWWKKNSTTFSSSSLVEDLKSLCNKKELQEKVLSEITALLRNNHFHGLEIPKQIHLHPEPFSIENNLLTTTMKLRRELAKETFAKEIALMYQLSGDNVPGECKKQE